MTCAVHHSPGFTLIEVMAVMVLTALVLGVTLDYYYDLSSASQRAMNRTQEVRRATAILDRVARDLESATLVVKPSGKDRLSHPWVFLGENRVVAKGSDRIKFVTRGYQPKRLSKDRHESDLAMLTYRIEEGEEGNLSLLRGISPRLPEGLDRDFPNSEEMLLLSDELGFFSFSFLDEEGSWQDVWDSSQLVQADQLPVAVKIELALAGSLDFSDETDEEPLGAFGEERAAAFSRTVVLPLRPLDLAALTDPKGPYAPGGGPAPDPSEKDKTDDEDTDSVTGSDEDPCPSRRTVRECFNIEAAQRDVDQGGSAGPSSIATFWNNPAIAGSCFDDHRRTISTIFIRPECL